MKQIAIAAMWGVLEEAGGRYPVAQLPQLLEKLKALGYGGIEITMASVMNYGSKKFEKLMLEKGMKFIAQVFSSGPPPIPGNMNLVSEYGIEHASDDLVNFHNVERHKAVWRGQVEEASKLKDILYAVTSHTGRDYFTPEEADSMFSYCLASEAELGLTINHETHRARILYSPWVMARYIDAHPSLHLVADYSHFSCVAELGSSGPYIGPLADVIAMCNKRVRHLHARVGFEEGPQVPDPREPLWKPYHEGYMVWWAGIVSEAAARGQEVLTTTPEFGPPMYAWTNPYNGDKTIVNVWDVNHWVGQQVCAMVLGAGHEAASLVDDEHKGVWELSQ